MSGSSGVKWLYEAIRREASWQRQPLSAGAKQWLYERELEERSETIESTTVQRLISGRKVGLASSAAATLGVDIDDVSIDMSQVWDRPDFRELFHEYMSRSGHANALLFLERAQAYAAGDDDDDDDVERAYAAAEISTNFLSDDGDFSLRDSGVVDDDDIAALELRVYECAEAQSAPADLFVDAVNAVFASLEQKVLPQFVQSEEFRSFAAASSRRSASVASSAGTVSAGTASAGTAPSAGTSTQQGGWVNDMDFRTMRVHVLQAFNLPSSALSRDPYVLITVDSKTYKSESLSNDVNPEWNETFEFPLLTSTQSIAIQVMDRSTVGSDNFLGRTTIPLTEVQPGEAQWHRLLEERFTHTHVAGSRGTGPLGDLLVRVEFSRDSTREERQQVERRKGGLQNKLRGKVSKKKNRFKMDGFDLDLTYVTQRVIAMGYPSTGMEGVYRNNMKEVKRFLELRHKNCYKVYNLCSERSYDPAEFHGRVGIFAFDDHNPCPFSLIEEFCLDLQDWLNAHPQNVAAVHCKAGKGRTGLMCCCFLLYSGVCHTADEALQYYAAQRTKNRKGVTIPSQIRYTHYFERFLRSRESGETLANPGVFLKTLRVHTLPYVLKDVKLSNIFFVCENRGDKYVSKKVVPAVLKEGAGLQGTDMIEWEIGRHLPVKGDVRIMLCFSSMMKKKTKVLQLWFHTMFLNGRRLLLTKFEIEKPHKDPKHKLFDERLAIELLFEERDDRTAERLTTVRSALDTTFTH